MRSRTWTDGRRRATPSVHPGLRRSSDTPKCRESEQGRRMTQGRVLMTKTTRVRGLVLAVMLASCAALPTAAAAQASTPTLTTTAACVDASADQTITVTVTGLT